MTSLVTDTTDTERDDEQTTDSDTHVRQRPAAQTRPLTETQTQTAYLPRTALGVIAVNLK
jgi:hypothetical protein